MRKYIIKNETHVVYDSKQELLKEKNFKQNVSQDWREANIGDWVTADDGCIIQILRKGKVKGQTSKKQDKYYVGTCTGTFLCLENTFMDTDKRENIYSFGGNGDHYTQTIREDKNPTTAEKIFATFIAKGMPIEDAYMKAFPTNNRKYALKRAKTLLKTERVFSTMKEELKSVTDELGIDNRYVLCRLKDIADNGMKEENQLRAVLKLSDILDLEDKHSDKVTQISGFQFQGLPEGDISKVLDKSKEIR